MTRTETYFGGGDSEPRWTAGDEAAVRSRGGGEDRDEANGTATTVGGGSGIDFPANGMTTTVGGGKLYIYFLCPWYV